MIQTYISGDPTSVDPQPTGFSGYVPPTVPATQGSINMPAGINAYTVTGLGLSFTPSKYVVTLNPALASDENIICFPPVLGWTASGFTVNFNDFLPNANYLLYWEAKP